MTTRRTFIKSGLAVTAAAAAGFEAVNQHGEIHPSTATEFTMPSPQLLLFDPRFVAARQMMDRYGDVPMLEVSSDASMLWQHLLRPRLHKDAVHVLGVTTGATAFCLAEMARDYGYEIAHSAVCPPAGFVELQYTPEGTLPLTSLHRPGPVLWQLESRSIGFRQHAARSS